MASVVIVHASEDALPARALAEKLDALKIKAIIETPPGEPLRRAIEGANAVLALWSPRSNQSAVLAADVGHAKTLARVFHARMQNAPAPSEFAGDPAIDLTGWRGEDQFPPWRELAAQLTEHAGVPLPPPPPPSGPAGFFKPSPAAAPPPAPPAAPPPAPRPAPTEAPAEAPILHVEPAIQAPPPATFAPAAPPPFERAAPAPSPAPSSSFGGARLAVIGAATFALVALVAGGGYFAWNSLQGGQAAEAAWSTLDKSDPQALRAFIESASAGALREPAQIALAELEQARYAGARRADTIQAYEDFLADFPDSDDALAARGRIAELRAAPPLTVPAGIETVEALPAEQIDPDLLPPGSEDPPLESAAPLAPAPAPPSASDGPTPLSPPPAEPAPEPLDPFAPPTN